MADVAALLASGLPPLGLGKFVGGVIDDEPRFAFYFINAWRADRDRQAERARALGGEVWLYGGGGEEHWGPRAWRDSREYIRREVRRMGAAGYLADPENGWAALPRAERQRELRALGEALAEDSLNMRVGLAFFPGMPDLETLAAAVGDGVFVLVEVFGRSAFSASAFESWVSHARELFGPARVGMVIAGYAVRPEMGTREGYDRYLSFLPDTPTNVVWNLASLPPHVREALARRDVGGNLAGSAAWGALALVARPAGAVLVAVVVLLLVGIVFAVRRASG